MSFSLSLFFFIRYTRMFHDYGARNVVVKRHTTYLLVFDRFWRIWIFDLAVDCLKLVVLSILPQYDLSDLLF